MSRIQIGTHNTVSGSKPSTKPRVQQVDLTGSDQEDEPMLSTVVKQERLYSSIGDSLFDDSLASTTTELESDSDLVARFHPHLLDGSSSSHDVSSRWVSNNNEPNGSQYSITDQRPSAFAGRKKYQLKGEPMGGTRSNAAAPYPTSGNGRKPNRVHPASANPSRYYIGTYYPNSDENDEYLATGSVPILRLATTGNDITCFRGQWEYGGKGDKDGKLHAQFAICFRDKCRVPQARRILGGQWGSFTGWLEPARSEAIWDYVCKEETRVQSIPGYGNLTDDSGHRTDLDVIYETIANGASIYEIMSQFPRQFMRNHAAISKLCAMYDKPREYGDISAEIWWGVTGSGKSHKAFHEYPDAYRKSIPGKWWDGYKGQKTVIFEEFNPEEDKELKLPELLKILDKYPYQIEIKGTSCQLKATKFIFTTNIDPRRWYEGHPQKPALCRRIQKVIKWTLNRDQQEAQGRDGIVEMGQMTMPFLPLE